MFLQDQRSLWKEKKMLERGRYRSFIILFSTGFYSGYFPFAPGTAGTGVGIFFFWCFSRYHPQLYFITTLAFTSFSVWIAEKAEKVFQKKDDPRIVIDEISGFLVTMVWVPIRWLNIGFGFFIFRFFDIVKPFPSRWIERKLPGGWGVVLDDIIAGLYSNIILQGVIHWT
ncbi:MAG: phosphatidylglycerophosphatase A [Deltaproteobacteria bacterium]|nr:MAG: phosphatidylglycerophosphatase A [Deltaproteobacteria bacterium]